MTVANDSGSALRTSDNYVTQVAVSLDSQTDCYAFASEPYSTAAGCSVAATTVVTVGELLIPNIFTPNRDGQNDTFRLLGMPADVAWLEIYSRWGNLVYAADRPAHHWDGGALPAGTYYYLLRVPDCPTVVKGWVELVR